MRFGLLILITAGLLAAQERPRVVKLEGARNFRDIGGYPTTDGKHVKWGRVFRSDALHNLTDGDYETLSKLGIRTVCDFRSEIERQREATKWRATPSAEILVLDIMAANPARANEDPTKSFMARLMQPGFDASKAAAMMADSMGEMATTAGPLYGKMIKRILEVDAPLVYHCTAGKDRTGLATALLMKTLGVKDEAIYEDYLLVNKLVPPEMMAANLKRMEAMLGKVDPELMRPLMGTRREWLEGAFQTIEKQHGSFKNYRVKVMGVSDKDVRALRKRLLE
jgi:protein-tyrosine phosphatase